jgi:hypothetical protein
MGACVLDKAQDFLHAVVVMGTCFNYASVQDRSAQHLARCPTGIVEHIMANLHGCCLGFEHLPAEKQGRQCEELSRPMQAHMAAFTAEFRDW